MTADLGALRERWERTRAGTERVAECVADLRNRLALYERRLTALKERLTEPDEFRPAA